MYLQLQIIDCVKEGRDMALIQLEGVWQNRLATFRVHNNINIRNELRWVELVNSQNFKKVLWVNFQTPWELFSQIICIQMLCLIFVILSMFSCYLYPYEYGGRRPQKHVSELNIYVH